jgi:Deoxyribose-phosphate aldolase
MKNIEKKMIYSNMSSYQVSDSDCEKLALAAIVSNISTVAVTPASLPAVNYIINDSTVKVAVAASYPSGAYNLSYKISEIQDLLDSNEHFDELYIVLAVGRYLSGYYKEAELEMINFVKTAKEIPVKVIIEAGMMDKGQKRQMCDMAIASGVKGIVSSTDFIPYDIVLPTTDDIQELKEAAQNSLEIIACGQINTPEIAEKMFLAGADKICSTNAFEIIQSFSGKHF